MIEASNLEDLRKKRLHQYRIATCVFIAFIIVFLLFTIFVFKKINAWDQNHAILFEALFVVIFALPVGFLWNLSVRAKTKFGRLYKTQIFSEILQKYESFIYDPIGKIPKDELIDFGIYPYSSYKTYFGKDYLTGNYNGQSIQISCARFLTTRGRHFETTFKGLCILGDQKRKIFDGQLIIRRRQILVNDFYFFDKSLKKVGTGNQYFDDNFTVYSDAKSVDNFLNDAFAKAIENLSRTEITGHLTISWRNQKFLAFIGTSRDYFTEPNINAPTSVASDLKNFDSDFCDALSFLEKLQL